MIGEAQHTKDLIHEVRQLRQRVVELEASEVRHQEVEAALRESEERYRNLLEQIRDGICILQDSLVTYTNPRLAQMWGGMEEDLIGTPFTDYVPPEELSRAIDHYRRHMRGENGEDTEQMYETVLTQRDGGAVHVELQTGMIAYKGRPAALVVVRDITKRQRIEEWVQWRDRLAAIGQLVAGITHEINGALTGILGFTQLAYTQDGVPEHAKADLEEAITLARRMDRFTRHILDLSRYSLPQKQLVDLSQLVRDAAEFLDRTLPMTIRIVLETTPDEFLVYADPVQIQQALTNLALNARDAMMPSKPNETAASGKMHLRLRYATLQRDDGRLPPEMEPGRWIALSVSDTGAGIPPEVLPHIYEPFFTTKDVGKGTGLGLAQVQDMIQRHDGFIEVQTEVGKGTTFTLYLPSRG